MVVISKGVSRAYVIISFKVINVMNKNKIYSIISHYNFNKSIIIICIAKYGNAHIVMPICMVSYMTISYGHANHAFQGNVCS
jgi:hypothetical protein